jgi:hypothetical protein
MLQQRRITIFMKNDTWSWSLKDIRTWIGVGRVRSTCIPTKCQQSATKGQLRRRWSFFFFALRLC